MYLLVFAYSIPSKRDLPPPFVSFESPAMPLDLRVLRIDALKWKLEWSPRIYVSCLWLSYFLQLLAFYDKLAWTFGCINSALKKKKKV
jgi:hypothetical protein